MAGKKELSYLVEALEDEVSELRELLHDKHEKLIELIGENDRLTMRYEPYRPENDEDAGRDFYELIEETKFLERENKRLVSNLIDVRTELHQLKNTPKSKKKWRKQYPKNGCVTLDFWPPRDWFRFSYHAWKPGMAAQLCIGPLRIDWFQS
jgi:regulator of replication initiation timing